MSLDFAKHKNILVKILKDIYTNPVVGPILGFKGGTAAYLFYNLDRFSVDLDFDLLDATKEDYVFEEVGKILKSYGVLKSADKKRFNLIYILSYNEKELGAQNVKVEINRRNFNSKFEVKSYLGISMKVMVREDMMANKLVAFYERMTKTNRDIYDVWFFLHNSWPINEDLVESRTTMSFKEFLKACLLLLEKVDNKSILSGMGELLTESQKDWVKKHLKEDLIFQFKLYLETHF